MGSGMENKKSFLKLSEIPIAPGIEIRIPTVGEILDDERTYYNIATLLTATPSQCMAQLAEEGIDFSTISDWEFFKRQFIAIANQSRVLNLEIAKLKQCCEIFPPDTDEYLKAVAEIEKRENTRQNIGLDFIFKDFSIDGFQILSENGDPDTILFNPETGTKIDKIVYANIAAQIRKINLFQYVKIKPGNEEAKRYLLEKEEKKRKRMAKRPYEPYLEKLVIALVNTSEFSYTYETCMDLSIYNFNQSLKQIQNKVNYDNTMIGVYAGTINISKVGDKSALSWIPIK